MRMKIINSQLMESPKVSFGYNSNLGVYATLMSDIPKLSEIAGVYISGGE